MARKIALVSVFFVLTNVLFFAPVYGQYFDVGVSGGMSVYDGEFNPDWPSSNEFEPAFGLNVRYHFTDQFALRLMLNRLGISGVNLDNQERTLTGATFTNFENILGQFGLLAEYHIIPIDFRDDGVAVSPYVTAGLSGFTSNPTYDDPARGSNHIYNEGTTSFSVPFGLGAKVRLGSGWYVNLEAMHNLAFSDELDGSMENTSDDAFSNITIGINKTLVSRSRVSCPSNFD